MNAPARTTDETVTLTRLREITVHIPTVLRIGDVLVVRQVGVRDREGGKLSLPAGEWRVRLESIMSGRLAGVLVHPDEAERALRLGANDSLTAYCSPDHVLRVEG